MAEARIKVMKNLDRPEIVELNVDGIPYYMPADQAMRLGETLLNAGVDARMYDMGMNSQEKRK
jgi:hypothetical protein